MIPINPGIVVEHSPIFNTVSIMPGIDCLAPDRTENNRGALVQENLRCI